MIKNILANLKIEQLNPMQEASIDAWKEGKDLILLSPTGSGKTLAYLLPLVESLKPDVKGVQAVVLVPSRELALQIDQVFKSMNTEFKAGTPHHQGGTTCCHYRYSGTYERPPFQTELRCKHGYYLGDR